MSNRDKAYYVHQTTRGGSENARKAQDSIQEDLVIAVSAPIVHRVLHEAGLDSFVKTKKPSLSEKNTKLRLEWAKTHVNWTMDDSKRITWSDETKIDRSGTSGKIYGWKKEHQQLQLKHVEQTMKNSPSLMAWSCIVYDHGVGWTTKIDGNINSDLHIQIFDEELKMTMDDYGLDMSKIIFM